MVQSKTPYEHLCYSDESGILEPLWEDGDGNVYFCECEIRDSHLYAIIRYLEREAHPHRETRLVFFKSVAVRRKVKRVKERKAVNWDDVV